MPPTDWARGVGGCRGDDLPLNAVVVAARRLLAPHIPLLNIPLVGAGARLAHVQHLLGLTTDGPPSDDVVVVGMYGMGGVGKTTLATKLRDEAPTLFDGRVVRLHVGDGCDPGAGLEAKRCELLELLSPGPPREHCDPDVERGALRASLSCGGPVLLILDDLWTRDQLLWLLGHDDCGDVEAAVASLAAGSRVLLTSRDQDVLAMKWPGFVFSELDVLDSRSAEVLLCLEAQRESADFEGGQLEQALHICGGLPLALQVLGRQLRDLPGEQWQVCPFAISCQDKNTELLLNNDCAAAQITNSPIYLLEAVSGQCCGFSLPYALDGNALFTNLLAPSPVCIRTSLAPPLAPPTEINVCRSCWTTTTTTRARRRSPS